MEWSWGACPQLTCPQLTCPQLTTTGGVSRFLRVNTASNPSSTSCRDRKVRLRPHHYSKDEGDERKRISAEALNNDITPLLPEQPVPFRIMPSSGDRREVPSRYQPSFYSHRCPGHSSAQRYRGQQFIALYKARNPQAVMVEASVPARASCMFITCRRVPHVGFNMRDTPWARPPTGSPEI